MDNTKLKEAIIFWQCRMSVYPFNRTKYDIDEFIKRTIDSHFVDLGVNEDNYINEIDKAIKELRKEGVFEQDSLLFDYPTRDINSQKLNGSEISSLYEHIKQMLSEENK